MAKWDPAGLLFSFKHPYDTLIHQLRLRGGKLIPEDINEHQLYLLFLVNREFGSHQKELADQLFITKQSVGVIIEFLISKKYLTKTKDPVDARANLIRLSDKGWNLVEQSRTIIKQIVEEWVKDIGEKNMKKLLNLLFRLSQEPK